MKALELALHLNDCMYKHSEARNLEIYVMVDGKKREVDRVTTTITYFADKADIVLELKDAG